MSFACVFKWLRCRRGSERRRLRSQIYHNKNPYGPMGHAFANDVNELDWRLFSLQNVMEAIFGYVEEKESSLY